MPNVILQTHNLTKHYGRVVAVDDLSLPVYEGEVFGFLGPNGAGKTTTIGMALGLIHPTAGSVEIFGRPVTPGDNRALRGVGSLVGAPSLVPTMTGTDNLRLLARLHDVAPGRVAEALARVDLTDAAGRKVNGYSTGMKQRLGLAAALLHRPSLVMLDEPTNGLDPAGMREMRRLIRVLADSGVTVFLSSHLLHEVEQVCDRIAVLNDGRVVAQGPVAELLDGQQQVVRLRVADPVAAGDALATLPGVGQITTNGTAVEVAGVGSEDVIRCLVAADVVPSEVTTQRVDLESLFLSLTEASTVQREA